MLDLSSMSQEQQDALLRIFEVAADNPLEQLKMDFLTAALTFKEWVEKNATNRNFQQAQKEIAKKTGIKLIQ